MEKNHALNEKIRVAFFSVLAAVFLTGFKLLVGILTGSLGIISEALHSGLDLVAAAITWFAVRVSDRPADSDHHFGHGKYENFSAFIETILLLITCFWIIWEATHRLITGKIEIEVTVWSYLVIIFSIIVDFSRSRALSKVAKKHNSQALEADALHFSTDIWSSLVVLFGLFCVQMGFPKADAIAALCVAMIVIFISYKLGRRAMDMLLDKSSPETVHKITNIVNGIEEVTRFHDIRVRMAGAETFIQLNIHVDPKMTIEEAHAIAEKVKQAITNAIPRSVVHIHEEPESKHD